MKQTKPIILVLVIALICCSNSFGQSVSGIGESTNSPSRPGILGTIRDGSSVYPVGDLSNAKAYPGRITSVNNSRLEFICNLISSCGLYPYGKGNNGDGAIVNLGGVTSGATVSGINSPVVRMVSNSAFNNSV